MKTIVWLTTAESFADAPYAVPNRYRFREAVKVARQYVADNPNGRAIVSEYEIGGNDPIKVRTYVQDLKGRVSLNYRHDA